MHALVEEMYRSGEVIDAAGKTHTIYPVAISPEDCQALEQAARACAGGRTLEVGMAYATSTISICNGLSAAKGGHHVAIDPYQQAWWHGIGRLNVERAGFSGMVTLHQEPSHIALPRLLSEGQQFDFIFIDGSHRFEHSLLDFFYADRMLKTDGRVMLHDTWMPATRKVLTYILRHFPECYELDGGFLLPPYGMLQGMKRLLASLGKNPSEPHVALMMARKRLPNYVVLRKTVHLDDEPYDANWDFYRSF